MPTTHKCPKTDCQVQVPRNRLACRTHWYLVSPGTRADVTVLWSEDGDIAEYMAARDRAIKEMNGG